MVLDLNYVWDIDIFLIPSHGHISIIRSDQRALRCPLPRSFEATVKMDNNAKQLQKKIILQRKIIFESAGLRCLSSATLCTHLPLFSIFYVDVLVSTSNDHLLVPSHAVHSRCTHLADIFQLESSLLKR
jgi:hypothetical protein